MPVRNVRIAATASAPQYRGAGALEKTSAVKSSLRSHHHVGRRNPE
jgi:hypothetical protein